jgi:hypothetical protein
LDNASVAALANRINESTAQSMAGVSAAVSSLSHTQQVSLSPSGSQLARVMLPFLMDEMNRKGYKLVTM